MVWKTACLGPALPVCPWASYLTSLCFCSPTYTMKIALASWSCLAHCLEDKCPNVSCFYYLLVFLHINMSLFLVLRIRQRHLDSSREQTLNQHSHTMNSLVQSRELSSAEQGTLLRMLIIAVGSSTLKGFKQSSEIRSVWFKNSLCLHCGLSGTPRRQFWGCGPGAS